MAADIVRLRKPKGAEKRSSTRRRNNLPDADFNPSLTYRDERPVSWMPESYQVGVSVCIKLRARLVQRRDMHGVQHFPKAAMHDGHA